MKELPCFEPSGILAEFSNQVNGVTLKFTEPGDAATPVETWGLYPFDGDVALDSIRLRSKDNTVSAFLLGREDKVAHIILDEITCSG